MHLSWITITPKLQQGISVLNSTNTAEFSKLIQEIKRFKAENTFTPTELQELEESLQLTANKLELLLQTLSYIFKQSSKVILKPTTLQQHLMAHLKFNNDKAEEFVKIWTRQTKEDFENLEDRLKLNKISWELNLQTASSLQSKEATPNLRLKLGLSNLQDSEFKNLVIELGENELHQMYATLENIQNKIDFLQRAPE